LNSSIALRFFEFLLAVFASCVVGVSWVGWGKLYGTLICVRRALCCDAFNDAYTQCGYKEEEVGKE